MVQDGFESDEVTFLNILKACNNQSDLEHYNLVNIICVKSGYESDLYVKLFTLKDKQQIFWNTTEFEQRTIYVENPKSGKKPWVASGHQNFTITRENTTR